MQITLESKPFAQLEADALVTYIFEESDPIQGRVSEIDAVTGGLLKKIASSGESTGKTLEFTLIHVPVGLKATRLLLVGPGKRAQFSGATLRKVAGAAPRDLVTEPSNKLTPTIWAERAEAMAKEAGLAVEILDEKKIADLKMGAILSVSQGSVEPPRVIVITYTPANAKPGAPVIGLVGKAVTFDTAGISIKPADRKSTRLNSSHT